MENDKKKRRMSVESLDVYYGKDQALYDVNMDIYKNRVTALIGASGCGKSTFLRCLNRMNDTIASCEVKGSIRLDGDDIYASGMDVVLLRAKIGMVFQKPNPFPKSIYKNVSYGPEIHGIASSKVQMDQIVEKSLCRAGLWDEVKDRLHMPALGLSGGQQQRLCIARAIAIKPEVLLMDEPCSALDPIATNVIEDLILELKEKFTIVMVTHSMAQARRISDYTAFFHMGKMVEYDESETLFNDAKEKKTRGYIKGKFG